MDSLERLKIFTDLAEEMLAASTHNQLGDALQILALNLAVYKSRHGDIPRSEILALLQEGRLDKNMAGTMADCMEQLCGVLKSVMAVDRPEKLN